MKYRLGIDFGTSTTKVSIGQDDKPPVALPISETGDKQYMPSVIAYRKTAKGKAAVYAIGEAAEKVSNTRDYLVVKDIKRFMEIRESEPNFPFQDYPWWNRGKQALDLWASTIQVEDVIQSIVLEALKRAIRRARELELLPPLKKSKWQILLSVYRILHVGKRHDEAALAIQGWPMRFGCYAAAGLNTRKALYNVARRSGFAGFEFDDIRVEPVLASLPYLNREFVPGDVALVYDFGGGTFSAAIIRVDSVGEDRMPNVTVLSTDGEPFCGGIDIDRALAGYLAQKIAQKYFNGDRNKIRDSGQLLNSARAVKEILSARDAYALVMPPDFSDRPGVAVDITRTELEKVIIDTGLLTKAQDCVLRAWRMARMVYRDANEVHGQFYLHIAPETQVVSKYVTELGFEDLKARVRHILLVGGTTKIPLLRNRLSRFVDSQKFIAENDPYEPIVACSLGAASQREHVGSVIDRLPFSVFVSQGRNRMEMYRAYSRTVEYKIPADPPEIRSYISNSYFAAASGAGSLTVECITPDNRIVSRQECSPGPGKYVLEINCYGCLFLKPIQPGSPVEIPNPAQHELQKAQWEKNVQEDERKKQEDAERSRQQLFQKPGEDHDVG